MLACVSCRHYNIGHGECRRYPPVAVVHTERLGPYNEEREVTSSFQFPEVEADTPGCGEYVKQPNEEVKL